MFFKVDSYFVMAVYLFFFSLILADWGKERDISGYGEIQCGSAFRLKMDEQVSPSLSQV